MTPEAQRIAIAEACGAKWFAAPKPEFVPSASCWPSRVLSFTETNWKRSLMPVANKDNGEAFWHDIPDYINDLNAMHEAEKMMTAEQEEQYVLILEELITPDFLSKDQRELSMEAVMFRDVHATAAQRAEAFLRTLGKWEDLG